jgi:hypothetical protein
MKVLAPLLLVFAVAAVFAAPVPKAKAPEVDIRDPDGKVVVTADEITGYDWDTHTLALKDGDRKKKLYEMKKFAVCIDGKPAYEVRQISPLSSAVFKGPTVVVPEFGQERPADEVQISGGYPGLIQGSPDLRDVPALKDALSKAGKLKAVKK